MKKERFQDTTRTIHSLLQPLIPTIYLRKKNTLSPQKPPRFLHFRIRSRSSRVNVVNSRLRPYGLSHVSQIIYEGRECDFGVRRNLSRLSSQYLRLHCLWFLNIASIIGPMWVLIESVWLCEIWISTFGP